MKGGSMIFEELSSRRCDVLGVSCPVLLSLRLRVSTRLAEATVWYAMGNRVHLPLAGLAIWPGIGRWLL